MVDAMHRAVPVTTVAIVLLYTLLAVGYSDAVGVPNAYACQPKQTKSKGLPFCDMSLSFEQRVSDLLGRLTLREKLGLIHADPSTDACAFLDSGVPRLDIPVYAWTEEANTGADSS